MANITMGDDEWIGFGGAAGRLQFDSTPTPDVLHFENCRVGIGVASPGSALQLDAGDQIRLESSGNGQVINVNAHNDDVDLLRVGATGFNSSGDYGFGLRYVGSRTGNNNSLSVFADQQTGTQVEALTIIQDGKVGIGTTSPIDTLHIVGGLHFSNTSRGISVPDGETLKIGTYDGSTFTERMRSTSIGLGIGTGGVTAKLDVNGTAKIAGDLTVDDGVLFVKASNNTVGIGTTSPTAIFHVIGSTKVDGDFTVDLDTLHVDADSDRVGIGTTNPGALLDVNGIGTFNNVGIGTTSPGAKLTVQDDTDGDATPLQVRSGDSDFSVGQEVRLDFQKETTNIGRMAAYRAGSSDFGLKFYSWDGSVLDPALTVVFGNVGVGTTNPTNKLHVDGTVKFENLPTSDPSDAGALWNDSGTLKISAG